MNFESILFSVSDTGVATISLNRPNSLNSMDFQTFNELREAAELCEKDESIRAVVLTGEGKAFSAGDDIKILDTLWQKTPSEISEMIETEAWPVFAKKLMRMPKPVIGCINGLCYGAGTDLMMSCDYVLASDKASFGHLYINLALMGNTYLLPRVVGAKKALELIWGGKIITANDALELGLINKVVPHENLKEELDKIANRLAKGPTQAYALSKKAVYESMGMGLDDGFRIMIDGMGKLFATEDHKEGVRAFFDKRKPNFKGK